MSIVTEWVMRGPALPPIVPQENSTYHTVLIIVGIVLVIGIGAFLLLMRHYSLRNAERKRSDNGQGRETPTARATDQGE